MLQTRGKLRLGWKYVKYTIQEIAAREDSEGSANFSLFKNDDEEDNIILLDWIRLNSFSKC